VLGKRGIRLVYEAPKLVPFWVRVHPRVACRPFAKERRQADRLHAPVAFELTHE
jgi:hypothetical protein